MSPTRQTESNDNINDTQLNIWQNTSIMSCITVYIQNKHGYKNSSPSVDKYSSRVKYNEGFCEVAKPKIIQLDIL